MGSLFGSPKPAKIVMAPPPPPPPTIDQSAQDEQYSRQLRRRRGFYANMVSNATSGVQAQPSVAVRQLLG